MADILQKIASDLYDGREESVPKLIRQALDQGLAAEEILNGGLIVGMDLVSQEFKCGDLYVPEVLLASRAMHAGMAILKPMLVESDVPGTGKYLIGTVKGDLHDIGKNLVKMFLEGAGFQVIDLGTNVAPADFVAAAQEGQPDLVGLSALLTTTMDHMRATIKAIDKAGLRDSLKIMVGGAPITAAFAEEIGADSYAPNAVTAVEVARSLIASVRGDTK